MWRRSVWLVTLAAAAAACSASGPDAPEPQSAASVCGAQFCLEYPGGWEIVDQGDDFASFVHPAGDDEALATVGRVNMEGIVTAAGGEWPQLTEDVARSFWSIIDGGEAALATTESERDGSVRTFGTVASGRLWWRLTPTAFSEAIGVEVRGPNRSWESHADVFFEGLTILD